MVPFGSAIDPSVNLAPLTEGLQIESIRIELVEEHVLASSGSSDGRLVNFRELSAQSGSGQDVLFRRRPGIRGLMTSRAP